MSLLRRSISSTSSLSQMDSDLSPIHREEVRIEDFNKSIENWEIPKVQIKEIYKQKVKVQKI